MAVLFGRFDSHRRRREAALADFFHFQLNRQAQGGNALTDRLSVDAGINQCSQRHVAANTAKTVKMSHAHQSGSPSLVILRLGSREGREFTRSSPTLICLHKRIKM